MRRILASTLACLLTLPAWGAAQTPPAQTPPAVQTPPNQTPTPPAAPIPQQPVMLPGSLKILILEGEGSVNNVERGLATPPVIEVRDRDDRPVEAATVVFRLPPSGPGGTFPGDALSRTVSTNVQGQALASGFAPNKLTGPFKIHVTATAGSRLGEININQVNSANQFSALVEPAPKKKIAWWKWAVIGGAAVGITVGIILATRGSSSPTSSNPTVTITPGPIAIGGR